MNTIIYSYTNCDGCYIIVIISSGIPSEPIIPRIKAAIKLGTIPIKDSVIFLNKKKTLIQKPQYLR